MRLFVRLVVAFVALAAAFLLLAPRVPEWRGWYASHACPYLDRISEGLCARSLQSAKPAPQASAPATPPDGMPLQAQTAPDQPIKAPEPPQNPSARLEWLSSEVEQIRQRQQWQDSALKEMEISLAHLHQTVLGLEQTVDALRVEIERVRLGATAPPAQGAPPPAPAAPPPRPPARR